MEYNLAQLLCDTIPELSSGPGVQPNAFFFPQDNLYVYRLENKSS